MTLISTIYTYTRKKQFFDSIKYSIIFHLNPWFYTTQPYNFLFFILLLKFSFMFSYLSFTFKIVTNSSWVISLSVNACDFRVSVLLSLLLAKIRILSYFFFYFLVVLNNFLAIPVVREKTKVKLTLAIQTGAPTRLINEQIYTPPVVALKTIKILSM